MRMSEQLYNLIVRPLLDHAPEELQLLFKLDVIYDENSKNIDISDSLCALLLPFSRSMMQAMKANDLDVCR